MLGCSRPAQNSRRSPLRSYVERLHLRNPTGRYGSVAPVPSTTATGSSAAAADTRPGRREDRSGTFAKGCERLLAERRRHRQAPLTHLPTHHLRCDSVTRGAPSRRAMFSLALSRRGWLVCPFAAVALGADNDISRSHLHRRTRGQARSACGGGIGFPIHTGRDPGTPASRVEWQPRIKPVPHFGGSMLNLQIQGVERAGGPRRCLRVRGLGNCGSPPSLISALAVPRKPR
jgi:hypothetical protein